MREAQFPLISLGSEKPDAPKADELAKWVGVHRGNSADLITWAVETTLAAQDMATQKTAGGDFYDARIKSAFGIADDILSNEITNEFDEIRADITAAQKIRKHIFWSLPLDLNISDAYFKNKEDFLESFSDAVYDLSRFMRDCGIEGHVLVGTPNDIFLEKMHSGKFLWAAGKEKYEEVLEYSPVLVCRVEDIDLAVELNNSYDIRKLLVRDADNSAMEKLLEDFEPERLYCAGFAPASDAKSYWDELSKVKARLTDI